MVFLLIIFSVSAVSADLLDDLKAKQAAIKTVSANFTQEKHTKLLSRPIKSDGRFFYKQPDRIRWEYRGNVNMQVIFNGRDFWIYYPALKEADKLSGLAQYSSMMHFDVMTMSRDHSVSAKKEKGILYLTFSSKTKGPISRIEMELPEDSLFPRTVRLFDQNNEPTIISFRDVKLDNDVRDDIFTFIPEKNITVRERSFK
jgi:outer membrane lipoprotein carrier protein